MSPRKPHPARMYDYYLGGKDNFEADREAADRALSVVPDGQRVALENRGFLVRAVETMAGSGIDQFIDLHDDRRRQMTATANHGRAGIAWEHRLYLHALRLELEIERQREIEDIGLGRRIGGGLGRVDEGHGGGKIDDGASPARGKRGRPRPAPGPSIRGTRMQSNAYYGRIKSDEPMKPEPWEGCAMTVGRCP